MIHKPKLPDSRVTPEQDPRSRKQSDVDYTHHPDNPRADKEKSLIHEIEEAILEQDTQQLRLQIQSVMRDEAVHVEKMTAAFELAENISMEGISSDADLTQEMIDNFETLPKIHLENHQRANTEVVHHFYVDQQKKYEEVDELAEEFTDEEIWNEIEMAVMEKGVMDLRDSLRQISASSHSHSYSVEDLENYIEGNMSTSALEMFEDELAFNPSLNRDIELLIDLDEAIAESDILELRETMDMIMSKETSMGHSLQELEAYLYNELDDSDKETISMDLFENEDLRAEVNLLRELDQAMSEMDVITLRQELHQISASVSVREEKSFIGLGRAFNGVRRIGAAAAVIVALLTISLVMRYSVNSYDFNPELLDQTPTALSSFRSAEPAVHSALSEGFQSYNQSDFHAALLSFRKVMEMDDNNPAARFFSGASYHNLKDYNKAIQDYNAVVRHNDNIFVEQAEWYSVMCLLKLDERDKALNQLQAIVIRKGFYQNKAETLLKQIRK
jgi:hypothetical protein